MEDSIRAVEGVLNYEFKKSRLLEDALTHPSYTGSDSYQRLEFVGDAALSLAITNFLFSEYKDLKPGELSIVRAANISTEKLARVAVRHRLYIYIRHNATALDANVRAFVEMVEKEDDPVTHGGGMKAPKVLADIVESIAAAVFVDLGYDLKEFWKVIRSLLEPIVVLDQLQQQPQPVTLLFELCQKDGKRVNIKHQRKGNRNIATVFVNGVFVASASSKQKETAKLLAAKAALAELPNHLSHMDDDLDETHEIKGAKQKLNEVCGKRKWKNPSYSIAKEEGPAHEKKYICSVKIEALEHEGGKVGNAKPRLKDADNSAASVMLHWLRRHAYI